MLPMPWQPSLLAPLPASTYNPAMILVTGGAGFIGSNIVAALDAQGRGPLVVCDRLRAGEKWRNIAKRELEDIVDPDEVFAFLKSAGGKVEAVIHMGAITSTTETDADLIIENNFRLSKRLWSWCAERGVRFIYASSAATYGDGSRGFDDDSAPGALAQFQPMNAYGWSKQVFDRWAVRAIADGAPAPPQWAGVKFFNVYGPNEYHKGAQASVVSHIFPEAQAGRPARLFTSHHPDYADGGQLRDFIYVDDAVAVVLWLLDHARTSGLFNCGTGEARSFADLATAVFRALGREPDIEYVPMPEAIRDRYQYFTEARMDRLRAAGFDQLLTSLEDGVRAYVQDYLATDDPYR